MPQTPLQQPAGKTTTSLPTKTSTPAVSTGGGFFSSLTSALSSLVQSIVKGISSYMPYMSSFGQAQFYTTATATPPVSQSQSQNFTPAPPELLRQYQQAYQQSQQKTISGGGSSGVYQTGLQNLYNVLIRPFEQTLQIQQRLSGSTGFIPSIPKSQQQSQQLFTPVTPEVKQWIMSGGITKSSSGSQVISIPTGANIGTPTKPPTTYSVNIPLDTGQAITANLTPQGEELFGLKPSVENLTITPQGTIMTLSGGPTGVVRDPLGGSTPIMGHIIQPGETLTKIARQYGTTVEEILRLNQDNKRAIKSRDLIIAGEVIRVPYKQPTQPKSEAQAFAGILSGQPKTAEEINKRALDIIQKYEALKQGLPTEIKPEDVQPLMMYMFGDMMRQMQETEARYREILDPTYYQRQYQQFLEQSGIPQLYQRYFDLNKILNSTRDDVLREAQAVGGIVTQSQIEEVVNWRTSIIKSEMQTLADMIELKEKSIDRMMKYVELDRKTYSDYLDNILGITEKKQKIIMDAFKWNLDWQDEIIKRNTQKLDTALKSGALADYSDELLLEMANPDSFLYTGYTLQELFALRNAARLIQNKKQEELRKMQEQLERQRQQMEISRERLQLERERLELQKEKNKPSGNNLESSLGL